MRTLLLLRGFGFQMVHSFAGDSMSCGIPVVTACDSVFIAPNLRRESAQTRLFFPAINLSNLAVLRFIARTYDCR